MSEEGAAARFDGQALVSAVNARKAQIGVPDGIEASSAEGLDWVMRWESGTASRLLFTDSPDTRVWTQGSGHRAPT